MCGCCLLSCFRRRKNVQMLAVDTPKDVDKALKKLCKDMSYKCKISKHVNVLKHGVPLIVVCSVTSRLEPDIDHALNGLNWQSPFIVLVIHQGNEDSLPGLTTETRLLRKPMYVNAEFVDIAYSLEFYACKMNEDAKQKIKEVFAVASAHPSTNKQAQKTRTRGCCLLSCFRSRKNVQVLAVDTPKDVDRALMKLCKDMSYKCKISKHVNALRDGVPLIVVCSVTSGLEPDIDHALNGLNWQSPFIVLVLHQGNEDSLPGLITAIRLPEKSKYEHAEFVDMAYSLEFYACKMNEDAKQEIKAFLNS